MNVHENDNGEDFVHLPNDYSATAGFHTLCGLCDMPGSISDTTSDVTCRTCLHVFAHVLRVAAERGVIRSMPSKRSLAKVKQVPE